MKYIGSKAKLAKDIVPILQKLISSNNIKYYIEPFVGGFNIIDKIECEHRIANDIDPLVCDLVEQCRANKELVNDIELPSRDKYYDVRDNADKYPKWYRAGILLFASYNARVYGGCYGAIAKTKDGKIRNYFQEAKNNFAKQLPNLSNIVIACGDYRKLCLPKNERCLIYCDPPYLSGVGYSIAFDSDNFWDWCRERTSEGNIVVVSEYNAPSDFECIWQKEVKTHLNNRNKLNKVEKLFIANGCLKY